LPPRTLLPILLLISAVAGCEPDGGLAAPDLEANPDSVLSCAVRWSTDDPATSRVEFGEGAPQFAVGDDALVTEHEVWVVGMRPQRRYELTAISVTATGEELRSDPRSFDTGALPFEAAEVELVTWDPGRATHGWTLTNMAVGLTVTPTVAVMLDMDGEVVWYHTPGDDLGRADLGVRLTDDDTVVVGGAVPAGSTPVEVDMAGAVLWEGAVQPEGLAPAGGLHHDFDKLSDGSYLQLLFGFQEGHLSDVIEQVDPGGEVLWSWNGWDQREVLGTGYPHGNAVDLDLEQGVAWYNTRDPGLLYRVDMDDGSIEWALGEDGDFELLGEHEHPWFGMQHAPEVRGDRVLIYDNGPLDRGFSRVVEYALDVDAMTAELVWEYPGELAADPWMKNEWGDADRLDSGNTLITAGSLLEYDDPPNRIFEVTPDGEIVWEVWFTSPVDGERAAPYRADRIPVLVEEV
jgi:hypothetical protein